MGAGGSGQCEGALYVGDGGAVEGEEGRAGGGVWLCGGTAV